MKNKIIGASDSVKSMKFSLIASREIADEQMAQNPDILDTWMYYFTLAARHERFDGRDTDIMTYAAHTGMGCVEVGKDKQTSKKCYLISEIGSLSFGATIRAVGVHPKIPPRPGIQQIQ